MPLRPLTDSGPRCDWVLGIDKKQLTPILGHKDHPITFDAPHLSGRQVGHHNYLFTNNIFWFEMGGDPGNDRPLFAAQVYSQLKQLIGFLDFFRSLLMS